uniref:Plasmid stabilization system, antitoxin protein RelB n=2 Tax=Thermococcus sp. EXT9 TaxID=1197732 RepID=L0BAH1_9EURY|nr:plasmid stabilization system, antitoxin protein RelB [Thermococcus sp. EXT9]
MSEVVNPYVLLQKIDHIERELEDLKVMLLKMVAEDLPEEEIDEETLKAFEKDLKDMIEGKVEVLSADEAIKLLSEEIKD